MSPKIKYLSTAFLIWAILGGYPIESFKMYAQAQSEDGITKLMRAARDGERGDFKSALKRDPDVNAQDIYGWTALMYAAANGEEGMAKSLLKKDADVDAMDRDGRTSLIYAARFEREKLVKLLIENGAALDHRDYSGARALGWAWANGNDKILDMLQKAGAVAIAVEDKRADLYRENYSHSPALLNREQNFRMMFDLVPHPSFAPTQLRMRILVGADGSVKKVRVLIGLPDGISEKAAGMARKLQFRPAIRDNKPVEAWYDYSIYTSGMQRIY